MKKTLAFWVCLLTSVCLFIGGFFVPPMGVIDGSLLKAVGMLLGFATLGQAPILLESLKSAKFTKGDMTVEVTRGRHNHQQTEAPDENNQGEEGSQEA
jgi:hypothetical protein